MVDWKERVQCDLCGIVSRAPGWRQSELNRAGFWQVRGRVACAGCKRRFPERQVRAAFKAYERRWPEGAGVLAPTDGLLICWWQPGRIPKWWRESEAASA